MPDLAAAMKQNPNLKVQMHGGYYDLATPYFSAKYELNHLPIPDALAGNLSMHFYPTGAYGLPERAVACGAIAEYGGIHSGEFGTLMRLVPETLSRALDGPPVGAWLVAGDEPLLVGEACDAIRAKARAAGFLGREVHFVERGFDWGEPTPPCGRCRCSLSSASSKCA
jgi:hypothetical protein